MAGPERIIVVVALAWIALCLGVAGFHQFQNPMDARRLKLDDRLAEAKLATDDGGFNSAAGTDYDRARQAFQAKKQLWEPLIAAPSKPKRLPPAPNVLNMLKGIRATRQEIVVGDRVQVRVYIEATKQPRWMTVGDRFNTLTVKEIRPDVLVFSLKKGGKEYLGELERR